MRVILSPQPGNPVVSARIAVRAGSRDENGAGEYGLAHLMEHMAFKGTSRRKVGDITREIESRGGDTNAYTSYEETVYLVSLPSDRLETAVDVLSDMVFHPAYDPEEYAREKEVVIEEIRRTEDNPVSALYSALYAESFGEGHVYGHRVIGLAETVAGVSRDTAFAFHDKFYRPDNAVLILTGGFDPAEARALAEKYLSDLERPDVPLVRIPVPAVPRVGPKIRVIRSPKAQLPRVILGFTCPSSRDSAAPGLELLSSVLSAGDSSRLVETVRDRLGLATSVGTYPLTLNEAGLFMVNYETEPAKLLPALDAVVAELNRASSEPPADDEIARARALSAKDFMDSQEAPYSMGSLISSFDLSYGDYRLKDAFLSIWSRILPSDLAVQASSVFSADNVTVAVLLPEDAPQLDEASLKAAAMKLSPTASGTGAAAAATEFRPVSLKSGARLYVLEDPTLPLVEVMAGVLGGRLAEKPGQEGAASLAASVWPRASGRLAAPEMARAVEGLGASVNGFSGRNSTGLNGSFLSSGWKTGLALYAELLTNPAFSQQDFDLKKLEHLTNLAELEENLAEKVFRIARKSLYRDHPYGTESYGTVESVEKLTRDDAMAVYRELVRPENLVFAVAGDVTAEEAAKAVDDALEFWKPAPPAGPAPSAPPAPAPLSGPVMVSEPLDRAQSHIAISFLAPGMGDRDQAALSVLDALFSGMGGVLYSELRDKKSLAYTVTSTYFTGMGTGSFNFYIACSPDKASEAVSGILQIIRESRDKGFSPETVADAKVYLAGSNKLEHQTLSSRVNDSVFFELYGLGQDHNEKLLQEIAAVTPEDVKRVAETYLALDRSVLSVVGSQASIDAAEGVFAQR
jgi:zinc protease